MKNLLKSLAKAQLGFQVIPKGRTARVRMKTGGEYTYQYADLSDVISATRKPLNENGLLISHSIDPHNVLITTLSHIESGEQTFCSIQLPNESDPQSLGSYITYYRRYAICCLLGVVAEEDTDAQEVTPPKAKQAPISQPQASNAKPTAHLSDAQVNRAFVIYYKAGWTREQCLEQAKAKYGVNSLKELTRQQYEIFCSEVAYNPPADNGDINF